MYLYIDVSNIWSIIIFTHILYNYLLMYHDNRNSLKSKWKKFIIIRTALTHNIPECVKVNSICLLPTHLAYPYSCSHFWTWTQNPYGYMNAISNIFIINTIYYNIIMYCSLQGDWLNQQLLPQIIQYGYI